MQKKYSDKKRLFEQMVTLVKECEQYMTNNTDHIPQYIRTLDDALTFLKEHPTMTSDLEMTGEEYDKYCEAFVILKKNPSPASITLFLNSLNKSSNESLVQGFTNVLKAFDHETVIEKIVNCLDKGSDEAKSWVGGYIYDFPDMRFVLPLAKILRNSESSVETGLMALNVLRCLDEKFNDIQIKTIIEQDYNNNSKWTKLKELEQKSSEADRLFVLSYRIKAADVAFMNKDYSGVVKELEEFESFLPELVKKKYNYSKKKIEQKQR